MRKNKIWLKSKRLAILAAMSAMMALTMGCSMSQFAFLKPGGGQLQRPQARQPEEAARIADNSPEPSPGAVAAEPALSPDPVIEEALLEPLGPAGQAAPEGAPELAIEAAAEIDAALEAGAHPAEGALSAEGLSPEALTAEALSPEALSQEDLTAEALSQQNLDQDGSSLEAGLALSSSEPVLATGLSSPADSVQFLEAAGTNEDVAALMAAAPALDGYADEGSQEAMEADSEDLADQAAYYEPVLINPALCSNGLTGTLATGRAGQGLLAAHGRSDPPSWVISAPLESASAVASTRIDNAPSSSKSARVRKAQTMQLLLGAYGQTGRPFKAGGKSPQSGFDPAGLLNWIYAQEGVKIPATAADQVAKGQAVTREELRPGDIMVYKTPGSAEYVVGLYTGNGNFILASSKLKVVTETAAFGSDYGPYFVGGRRYLDDPSASPLSDDLKTAAANQAVKVALTAMGDNIPKPANIYGGTRKAKGSSKRKATRRKSRSSAKRG